MSTDQLIQDLKKTAKDRFAKHSAPYRLLRDSAARMLKLSKPLTVDDLHEKYRTKAARSLACKACGNIELREDQSWVKCDACERLKPREVFAWLGEQGLFVCDPCWHNS